MLVIQDIPNLEVTTKPMHGGKTQHQLVDKQLQPSLIPRALPNFCLAAVEKNREKAWIIATWQTGDGGLG